MYNNPGQQRELARPYRKSLLIALLLITFVPFLSTWLPRIRVSILSAMPILRSSRL